MTTEAQDMFPVRVT